MDKTNATQPPRTRAVTPSTPERAVVIEPTRSAAIPLSVEEQQVIYRLRQLRNGGVTEVLVRISDWHVVGVVDF